MADDVPGIRLATVEPWLEAHVAGTTAPFSFDLITGGESNFTFRVTDAAGERFVLRRPPAGELLATAHDMLREARIMTALADTPVAVPEVLATCDDVGVTGAAFYVMRLVDGAVLRTRQEMSLAFEESRRADACRRLIEALVAIHAADLADTGLADLAKHDGYVQRQLRRWHGQWEAAGAPHRAEMSRLHADLQASLPASAIAPAALVHGDFRFDNAVVGPDGSVRAVLDWELSTLGHPLADLGITIAAWSAPGEAMSFGTEGPTSAPGCLTRSEAVAHYSAVSGRDVADFGWYLAWANWRIACILSGVLARNAEGGGRGTHSVDAYHADLVGRAQTARAALDSR